MKTLQSIGLLLALTISSITTVIAKPDREMFRMDYEIEIGNVTLKGIESVTVESSVDALVDTCTITLPGMIRNKAYQIEDKIKRGDKVAVKLGYDGNLSTEFVGYLRAIYPNTPMKLEFEDAIFLTRKDIKDKTFAKTNVVEILQYVVDELNKQLSPNQQFKVVTDMKGLQFDKFTILRANGFQVLDKLKQETGLAIYAKENELHCHLKYTEKTGSVTYDFTRNLEESSDLQYVKKEDTKVLVKVIGRTKKGANIEVEVGEKGGDVRTFQRPTISDKASLETIAKEELKHLSYDGYKGSVKGWLLPICATGYTAKVIDPDYKEREGSYYVNAVKTEFSASGGRRTVTLGVKVS
ncbi:hypothetical protein ACFPMF_01695 [Larkinella bovis]|uniref:Uncharacterized protein n=1 Tax=Larkinella bovis TaxID=683041 RepID=A0ABW0I5B7_9BACT